MILTGGRKPVFFFKIILHSNLVEETLMIPDMLALGFRDDLSSSVTLVVPPGKNWTVKLLSDGGKVWLREGIAELFKFYSVSFGYFFLFEYHGKSEFGLRIFDLTACEILYHSYDASRKVSLSKSKSDLDDAENAMSDSDQDDDDDDDDANYTPNRDDDANYSPDQDDDANCDVNDDYAGLDVNYCSLADEDGTCTGADDDVLMLDKPNLVSDPAHVEELSSEDDGLGDQPCEDQPCKMMEVKEEEEDDEENVTNRKLERKLPSTAPISIVKAKNVSFRTVMKPSDFEDPISLSIPPKIGRKFPQGVSRLVKLEVSDGRTWTVQGNFDRGRLTSLGKGWADFICDTQLMPDDICQFELITYDDEFIFKVSMSRKKPLTS